MQESSDNKRIAKNTMFLYLRMMITMVVSLYTSRLVLSTLGVYDFGIQNVVGGLVSTFSLLSSTMNATISRYLTFEIGRGDIKRLKIVFSTSLNIQIVLILIIVVAAETIGLWFLYNKMEIPQERVYAAVWVYHCSLVSFVFNLISVPYSSVIISHERMGVYAYMSVLEVFLRLGIVLLLVISKWDKLITYAVLLMMVSMLMSIIYGLYCSSNYQESKYCYIYDRTILREMLTFSSYNYMGAAAYILRYQGINLLTNLFFGVAINAARGVVASVESAVSQFVGNFTMALNPPITKAYARGDITYMQKLVCQGAKYSFYMMMVLVLPVFFEAPIILEIWLTNVPAYTSLFLRLTLAIMLIDILSGTITTAILSTGDLKFPQMVLSPVMIMVLPISYLLFKIGFPAYYSYVVFGIIVIIRIIIELFFLQRMIHMSAIYFVKSVLRPCAIVLFFSLFPFVISFSFNYSLLRLFLIVPFSLIWSSICVYCFGITGDERKYLDEKCRLLYKKLFCRNRINIVK